MQIRRSPNSFLIFVHQLFGLVQLLDRLQFSNRLTMPESCLLLPCEHTILIMLGFVKASLADLNEGFRFLVGDDLRRLVLRIVEGVEAILAVKRDISSLEQSRRGRRLL